MKIFEIILKLLFLSGSILVYKVADLSIVYLAMYLSVCLLLGIVLFFNKNQSYGYELSKREVVIRKVEGVLLASFSIFWFISQIF